MNDGSRINIDNPLLRPLYPVVRESALQLRELLKSLPSPFTSKYVSLDNVWDYLCYANSKKWKDNYETETQSSDANATGNIKGIDQLLNSLIIEKLKTPEYLDPDTEHYDICLKFIPATVIKLAMLNGDDLKAKTQN